MFNLLRQLFSTNRPIMVTIILLMVITSLLEGFGIALLFPLLVHLGVQVQDQSVYHSFVSALRGVGLSNTPSMVAVAAVSAFVLQYLLLVTYSFLGSRFQAKAMATWRRNLFGGLLKSNWRFLVRTKTAEMLNAVAHETHNVGMALGVFLQTISNLTTVAIYLGLSLFLSWRLTLFMLLVGVLMALVSFRMVRKAKSVGTTMTRESENLFGWVSQIFSGMKLVKASGAESYAQKVFEGPNRELERTQYQTFFQPHTLRAVIEVGGISAVVVALVLSQRFLALDAATVMIVLALFYRLYPRLTTLQQNLQALNLAVPSFVYMDSLRARAETAAEIISDNSGEPVPSGPVGIRLKGVSVHYSRKAALENVDLTIESGKITAIVGASGAGKTTLVDCLLDLVAPDAGRVEIEGRALSEYDRKRWRERVAYVGQDVVLFDMSIRENVVWNRTPSDPEIEEALRKANAFEFTKAAEKGLDTTVGEQGARLSGGQRQRIGLARALLGRKSLLILDEATSALDATSENDVLETVKSLRGEMTIVIVSHRLASLRCADEIYVLEEGQVVESGSWSKLVALQGRFSELWHLQSKSL